MKSFPGKVVLRPWVLAARRVRRREWSIVDLAFARPSYSQFGEDLVLATLLADSPPGRYVDVGAFDPHHYSNTYLLHRRGWRGINIEPVPAHHAELARHRTKDVNLPLAVDAVPGQVQINVSGTFSGIVNDAYPWGLTGTTVAVQAQPLSTSLAEHLAPGEAIDLLSVDCEGADLVVLQSHDWDRNPTRIVVVELHEAHHITELLQGKGYVLHARAGLSGVFVRDTPAA
jgi:FkbM family methyltransferase